MKRYCFLLILVVFFGRNTTNAQMIVSDPGFVATLLGVHIEQQQMFKDIHESQTEIRNYQILIDDRMRQINKLQEKTYDYLSKVNSVVKTGKDIIYASDIVIDIGKYQNQAREAAKGEPELLLVVAKTEYELISRSVDLMLYIYNMALKGGEQNLLDNKQRIDLVTHVVSELRIMRGLAYSISRQVRTAKRNGVLKTLNPRTFRYITNNQKIVDRLINDIEFIKKGGY